jgi:hypothetical protein
MGSSPLMEPVAWGGLTSQAPHMGQSLASLWGAIRTSCPAVPFALNCHDVPVSDVIAGLPCRIVLSVSVVVPAAPVLLLHAWVTTTPAQLNCLLLKRSVMSTNEEPPSLDRQMRFCSVTTNTFCRQWCEAGGSARGAQVSLGGGCIVSSNCTTQCSCADPFGKPC